MGLGFFGRSRWNIRSVAHPWGDRPCIYRYVNERLGTITTSLSRAGDQLPDEDRVAEGAGFRWASGALDGVFSHHAGGSDPRQIADKVFSALTALTETATSDHASTLYALLTKHAALEYVDSLLPMITESTTPHRDRVRAVARWLATESADREPVKAAIAMLGVVSRGNDRELLLTLGKHDEFTLFSAVALQRTEEHPESVLRELARHVTGWGRIHIIERLAATDDDGIKAWLLREGCRNDIMDEYTALICATTGDLLTALRGSDPDQPLMKGGGAILAALIRGGPAPGIEAYADGLEAAELYLAHLRRRDPDLEDLNWVAAIERWAAEERNKPDGVAGCRDRVAAIHEHLRAIRARPDWPTKIHSGLTSDDRSFFLNAVEGARLLGIDAWDIYFERLERGEDQWYLVTQTDDPARIDRVVTQAERQLSLEKIAGVPADDLGWDPGYEAHRALESVIHALRRFPGKGWPLVRTALQSPVTRNRNMALRTLAAWQRSGWPAETEPLLRHALETESNDDTREWMQKVLDGEPLES